MFYRKIVSFFATLVLGMAASAAIFALPGDMPGDKTSDRKQVKVAAPLNIAILIQDDLISQVGNELNVTRDFIRSLPAGSRVMVGYLTTGTIQVRQPFTTDLERATSSLRLPRGGAASPFNPYVEVIEALQSFNSEWTGANAVLLISDGLDVSRGFDASSAGHTIDLDRAIKHANERNVAVYTFYAPAVGLTSRSRLAASYGQSSLNRLADETGGKAFFQGTSGFVTFDSYFRRLRQALNEQYARAS